MLSTHTHTHTQTCSTHISYSFKGIHICTHTQTLSQEHVYTRYYYLSSVQGHSDSLALCWSHEGQEYSVAAHHSETSIIHTAVKVQFWWNISTIPFFWGWMVWHDDLNQTKTSLNSSQSLQETHSASCLSLLQHTCQTVDVKRVYWLP